MDPARACAFECPRLAGGGIFVVDGGASSPATATPSRFCLRHKASGRKICKEEVFLLENGIFRQKNFHGFDAHVVETD